MSATKEKDKEFNIKLYPFYKAFGADVLFYYAIEYIFMLEVKGFSPSQILLTDSLYPFFRIFLNIPSTVIADRIGKKNSLVLGNIFLCISILILILAPNLAVVSIGFFFMSFSFSLKKITETNILADSVDMKEKEGRKLFSIVEAIGNRNYYLLDGVTSFFTGFSYIINPYLPMIITLVFAILATYLSTLFKHTSTKKEMQIEKQKLEKKHVLEEYKKYFISLKDAFRDIFQSNRIKSLLLFVLFFDGLIYASYSLRETLLTQNLNITPEYFSIIIAVLTIVSGLTSTLQKAIQKKFNNRALQFVAFLFLSSFLLIAIIASTNMNYYLKLSIILILFAVQYGIQSPYLTLMTLYSKNFAGSKLRIKISSVTEFIHNISEFLIAFIASILLNAFSITTNFYLVGIFYAVVMTIILIIIKNFLGLPPDKYSKEDVFNKEIK